MLGGGVICSYLSTISIIYTYRHPSGCACVHSFQLDIQDVCEIRTWLAVVCMYNNVFTFAPAITAMHSVADRNGEWNVIQCVGGSLPGVPKRPRKPTCSEMLHPQFS